MIQRKFQSLRCPLKASFVKPGDRFAIASTTYSASTLYRWFEDYALRLEEPTQRRLLSHKEFARLVSTAHWRPLRTASRKRKLSSERNYLLNKMQIRAHGVPTLSEVTLQIFMEEAIRDITNSCVNMIGNIRYHPECHLMITTELPDLIDEAIEGFAWYCAHLYHHGLCATRREASDKCKELQTRCADLIDDAINRLELKDTHIIRIMMLGFRRISVRAGPSVHT